MDKKQEIVLSAEGTPNYQKLSKLLIFICFLDPTYMSEMEINNEKKSINYQHL